jgi:hypothetical protein
LSYRRNPVNEDQYAMVVLGLLHEERYTVSPTSRLITIDWEIAAFPLSVSSSVGSTAIKIRDCPFL